jgi:prepilin-type N-terminal cleavage/methylation domain-containing protein
MRARVSRAAGFSMVEVAITITIFGITFAAFSRTHVASTRLATASYAILTATDEQRRGLDAIAAELRGADYQSLSGFNVSGVATSPSYKRAIGSDESGRVLDVTETLSWRSVTAKYNGVASPGEVIKTRNGVATVVARHVPSGGLSVALVGNTLRITLTTFRSNRQGLPTTVSATTYVSLRN